MVNETIEDGLAEANYKKLIGNRIKREKFHPWLEDSIN
jgi:hypothetical protein